MSYSNLFFRYLDTVGNGTGTKDASGDYSSAATEFKFVPAVGTHGRAYVGRLVIHIVDGGSFDADSYGNGITLTNGITFEMRDGSGQILDLCDGEPIMTNSQYGRLAGPDVAQMDFGSGNNAQVIRWTFSKTGSPLKLDPAQGHYFSATLNDDFTNLVSQHFMVQGCYH